MVCHSTLTCHSPLRSLNLSLVATLNLATGVPPWRIPHLRVFTDVSDKNDFVYALWHGELQG
jgi:hypothetical protein